MKSRWIITKQEDGKRLIDSNELVLKKIEEEKKRVQALFNHATNSSPESFSEGLQVEQVDALFGDGESERANEGNVIESLQMEAGFQEGSVADGVTEQEIPKAVQPVQPVYTGPSPEELIEEAEKDIEAMKARADAELREKEKHILHEAETSGYVEGKRRAEAEFEQRSQALLVKERELQEEYERKLKDIEAELVTELADVYSHVLGTSMKDYGPTVLHVLDLAIHESDEVKNYMIHVSKDEYSFVKENTDTLKAGLSARVEMEIIEDVTISPGNAYIETDGEIFDCSVETTLSSLSKQMKALAYQKK